MLSGPSSYQVSISEGALKYKTHVLVMHYLVRVVNITYRLTNLLIVGATGNDQGRHRVHSFRDYSTLQYKSLQHESLPEHLGVMTSKHKDRYKGSPSVLESH